MYRYLLFGYDQYYPLGGMEDCLLKTNKREEITKKIKETDFHYYELYDCFEDTLEELEGN